MDNIKDMIIEHTAEGGSAMETVYIAVEKNVEVFELYRALWKERKANGIMVKTMAEAIETATRLRNSKTQYLYFISISADDIDYAAELPMLSESTDAPIMVATSQFDEDKHDEAINKGAFFYGQFCGEPDKNIRGVITQIKRYYMTIGKSAPGNVLSCGGVTLSLSQRTVYVNGAKVDLTNTEFNVLSYLLENRGSALSYEQIYDEVWKERSGNPRTETVKVTVKRLRRKISTADNDSIIENIWGYGYKVPL